MEIILYNPNLAIDTTNAGNNSNLNLSRSDETKDSAVNKLEIEAEQKCLVCEIRPAESKHYKVPSCNACYKFFQRSMSSKLPFRPHSHTSGTPPE